MRLEYLRKAYKLAEDVTVNYEGMTSKQIKELDNALDIVFKIARDAIERAEAEDEESSKLSKIKEITERALRSSDPINLYKACCINEIAEILGVKLDEPDPAADNNDNQITIDDIIEEG